MTRSLFFLVAIATTCSYFATAILALGIPANLAKNASQPTIQTEVAGTNLGLQPRLVKGISDELFHTFQLMAQYSAAAYCRENNISPHTLITCHKRNCPLVEEAGARSVMEFENGAPGDVTGFVAVDETNRLIVVAFRGTFSFESVANDGDLKLIHTDLCDGCKVHKGFWLAWLSIRDRMTVRILNTIHAYPGFRLVVTGHSLGGALAALTAANLRTVSDDFWLRIELYTFGCPRIGNDETADFLTNQSDRSHRITNRADWIPHLPSHASGYHQTYPEYFISHHSADPHPQDFQVLVRDDHKGNAYTANFFSGWKKHDAYFMKSIAGCVGKFTLD